MALSILTLNCNGIRDQPKRLGLLQWLRSMPLCVDVVSLQETHCFSMVECQSWFTSSGFNSVVSPGSAHSCGCVVLFRPSLSLVNSWCDSDGRFLQCEFSYQQKSFRVCFVYGPNRNPARDQFFHDIASRVDPSIPTLLAGDFNSVFDRALDCFGSDPSDSSRESSAHLRSLFDSCCVVDIWRYLHPSSSCFTWTRWNGSVASRIDLLAVPHIWVPSFSSCDIVSCPFSDHCGVLLSVSVPDVTPPGPGLWKLNSSILSECEYIELISDAWSSWRHSMARFPSLAKWWEEGKGLIKGLTIQYCCSRSAAQSRNRELLVRLVDHLKSKVDLGWVSCLGPYHSAAKGAQVRSRIRWVVEGETSSAYFLRLEKKCSADWWISALWNDDGSIVTSPDDLCRSFSSFYGDLFTAANTDPSAQVEMPGNLCRVRCCRPRRLQLAMVTCQLMSVSWPSRGRPGARMVSPWSCI